MCLFSLEYPQQSYFTIKDRLHQTRILYITLFSNFINIILTIISPFVIFPVLFFHLDPSYFVVYEYLPTSLANKFIVTLCIVILRASLFYFFVLVMCRHFCFLYLIETCRINMYSHCLTLLHKITSANNFYAEYGHLHICHGILCSFFDQFYYIYPTYCQITIVGFLWLCIRAGHLLPFLIWTFAFIFALMLIVVVFFTMSFSVSVHLLSDKCIRHWQVWHPKSSISIVKNAYWERVAKAQQPLRNMFGPYFVLDMASIMLYLNLLLQNLASSILLIRL